jgi:hypothetical protein
LWQGILLCQNTNKGTEGALSPSFRFGHGLLNGELRQMGFPIPGSLHLASDREQGHRQLFPMVPVEVPL